MFVPLAQADGQCPASWASGPGRAVDTAAIAKRARMEKIFILNRQVRWNFVKMRLGVGLG